MTSQYQRCFKHAKNRFVLAAFAICGAAVTMPAQAVLIGPLGGTGLSGEYSQFSDSPFAVVDFSGGYFHFEDFEDHPVLNVPGVSPDTGDFVTDGFGPGIHDSVDLDDGFLDGSGLDGESWFTFGGPGGVKWTFDAVALGSLPTHAGIVWTDGAGTIEFEAFDAFGVTLGTVGGTHATSGSSGQTDEDRFYGVIELGGISMIKLSNTAGGIEMDHLQYGNQGDGATQVPEPSTLALLAAGLLGLVFVRRRRTTA